MDTEMNNRRRKLLATYPSSWHRFFAFQIDFLLVTFGSLLVVLPLIYAFDETRTERQLYQLLSLVFCFAISWVYSVKFERSRYRATPGKLLFKLQVTDESRNRISFDQANIRFLSKAITLWVFSIGFLVVVFTEKRQGIHDKLANTFVKYKVD